MPGAGAAVEALAELPPLLELLRVEGVPGRHVPREVPGHGHTAPELPQEGHLVGGRGRK